jgi:hypothetical protein
MLVSSHCFEWAGNLVPNLKEMVRCWKEGK